MSLVLCDDHELFAEAVAGALRGRGHDILTVSRNPASMVDDVVGLRPDACLLDVAMPGTSGIDVAKGVRSRAPSTAIILLTAAGPETVWHAVDDGLVDGAVNKDCDISVLDRAIHRVVSGGARVVEGWARPVAPRPRLGVSSADHLTTREREVLHYVAEGTSTAAMAELLGVSHNTVRTHVQSLLRKLHVHDRGKAARLASELALDRSPQTITTYLSQLE